MQRDNNVYAMYSYFEQTQKKEATLYCFLAFCHPNACLDAEPGCETQHGDPSHGPLTSQASQASAYRPLCDKTSTTGGMVLRSEQDVSGVGCGLLPCLAASATPHALLFESSQALVPEDCVCLAVPEAKTGLT